jgi:hypothetical protein
LLPIITPTSGDSAEAIESTSIAVATIARGCCAAAALSSSAEYIPARATRASIGEARQSLRSLHRAKPASLQKGSLKPREVSVNYKFFVPQPSLPFSSKIIRSAFLNHIFPPSLSPSCRNMENLINGDADSNQPMPA